jgi:membrane-bound ClpP family serine protease
MPRKKTIHVKSEAEKIDEDITSSGITHKTIIGFVLMIVGLALLATNLTGILLAFIGFVLIYFGLKFLGYTLKL